MFIWIGLVVVGQLFNTITAIVDKFIVTSKTVPKPYLYAFFVSVLSSSAVAIFAFSWVPIPLKGVSFPSIFSLTIPSIGLILTALIAGFAFFGALLTLYSALKDSDASDVIPVIGSASAVSALVLSVLFFHTALPINFLWGFAFLVLGTIFMSHLRLDRRTINIVLLSGLFWGIHFVTVKEMFNMSNFADGFLFSRIGIVIAALVTLILPANRHKFGYHTKKTGARGGLLVIGNKTLAGLSSVIILKAIQLGPVSLVQALGGLQFVFLLLFAAILGRRTPREYGENVGKREFLHKLVAISIIVAGFFVLFI